MKRRMLALAILLGCILTMTGCASLLERQYVTSDLHTSKFWESEAADTLRAENQQDIVNDLLLLIGQHKESATVRLYNVADNVAATDAVQKAASEVRQETPMGAYAVEYITSSVHPQRGYYEIDLIISYRRTAEQVKDVVYATSAEAVASLLEAAVEEGKEELAVRIGYWDDGSRETIDAAMARLREERGIVDEPYWAVNVYPESGQVGLVEFLLNAPAPEKEVLAAEEMPAEEAETAAQEKE
ncbi:MAG: hypothetical protein IJF36_06995 [Oscillibacter sp.]|nr:hypothetical protein [Oscillibacter sp.]